MGYTGAYDLSNGLDYDEEDHGPYCEYCGAELDWTDCWSCHGQGFFDLYEMYPLEYEPGETDVCTECNGEGGYLECPNVPHKEANKNG